MRLSTQLKLPTADRRGAWRSDARIKGTLRGSDDMLLKVDVVNISSHGCRIDLAGKLPEAALVKLKLGSAGFFACRVVWSHVGTAGLEFSQPLHPDLVHQLMAPPRRH